jgi:hypothetical protein
MTQQAVLEAATRAGNLSVMHYTEDSALADDTTRRFKLVQRQLDSLLTDERESLLNTTTTYQRQIGRAFARDIQNDEIAALPYFCYSHIFLLFLGVYSRTFLFYSTLSLRFSAPLLSFILSQFPHPTVVPRQKTAKWHPTAPRRQDPPNSACPPTPTPSKCSHHPSSKPWPWKPSHRPAALSASGRCRPV